MYKLNKTNKGGGFNIHTHTHMHIRAVCVFKYVSHCGMIEPDTCEGADVVLPIDAHSKKQQVQRMPNRMSRTWCGI